MKRIFLLLFVALLSLTATAQNVQWASKVVAKSSEYGDGQYSAKQVLGKPNVMPGPRESPCAWSPLKKENRMDEFLHLEYAEPMQIRQVCVVESFNPGAVSHIYLYNPQGKEYLVYNQKDLEPLKEKGRMLSVTFDLTEYKVKSVKVVLNTLGLPGYHHIDAVGISDSETPIEAQINLVEDMVFVGEPENLGPNINTIHDEIMPVISPDGKTLYFDRKDHPENTSGIVNDDIWIATANASGGWSVAENPRKPFNTAGHNFLTGISADGKFALLGNIYEADGTMGVGVSFSQKKGETWTFPQKALVTNYYNNNKFSEFHLHASGGIIVMTVQRNDSYGGKDIYVSFLQAYGSWSEPKNIGVDVNTAATEMSPFIAADGKTLYFASDGRSGYGLKDMFVTRRLDETWTHWSEPQNLGPKINTDQWDAYYSLPASGDYAYFSSEKGAIGKTDIYRIQLPKEIQPDAVALVRGVVHLPNSTGVEGPMIRVSLLCDGKEVAFDEVDSTTGEYTLIAQTGCKYQLVASAQGFQSKSIEVDCTNLTTYREVVQDFDLKEGK